MTADNVLGFANIERKWWVLAAIGVGTFMSALDSSVVNMLLPVIGADFSAGVAAVEWVSTIYLLVVSGLLLSFGRLGDLRGQKPVYVSGFGVFILGSALCGLAPSAAALIGFRGAQALGAAMLFASSPAILTKNFPAQERGRALGLQATMTYLGLTVGPSLGGWLAAQFGWRAVFYINVPIGLLALTLSMRFIPHDRPADRPVPFDLAGAVAFMAGLVALLLGLNQGAELAWTSPWVLGALAIALVLLGAFVLVEHRNAHPMLDLTLFSRRLFTGAAASAVLNYVCLYSITFLMPFYLMRGRGLTSAQAGLILTAQPLVMAVSAPISGALSDRIGSRLPATLGMALLAGGLFLLSRLGPQTPWPLISAALAVAGLGTGIFISPNSSALMGAAPRDRQGIAAGVLATARNVGMVLGIGLAGAVFTSYLVPGAPATLFAGVSAGFAVAGGVALAAAGAAVLR